MGVLDEVARANVKLWLRSSGRTQAAFGEAMGYNQSWASRYLDGTIDADCDLMQRMAEFFGHTIFTLLSVTAPTDEGELLGHYRALTPEQRGMVRQLVRDLATGRHRPPRAPRPKKR